MLIEYSQIILFIILGFFLAFLLNIISVIVISRFNAGEEEKLEIYECGFESFSVSRIKFDVWFYLMSILFIVFDLEVMYLFPWCVIIGSLDGFSLVGMFIFLFILLIGFVYEWKKGALDWE